MPLPLPPRLAAWRDLIAQDIRYALRGFRLRPGFTAVVVLTLSLGIGANATMFGIIDRLLLRAPPYIVAPDRVVQFHAHTLGSPYVQTSQSYAVYTDLLAVADFQSVAVATATPRSGREHFPLGRGPDAGRVVGAQVSPGYFPLLGVRPYRGRFFGEDEAGERNPQKLAVVGYGFWKRQFGGRDGAIGERLTLGSDQYTIVGVLPPGFTGTGLVDVDVWIPIAAADGLRFIKSAQWNTKRGSQWLDVLARLRPGASIAHARAQATAAYRAGERLRLADVPARYRWDPDSEEVMLGSIIPGRGAGSFGIGDSSGEVRVSRLLAGVAVLVLLIACANVANLLLVRGLNRRREIAVRLALGVSRRRLIGQLVLEGVLLSILGAAGALLCAQLSSGFIRVLLLRNSAWSGGAVDGRVLAFTAVVALATGLLTSLVPALQASRPELTSSLKSGAREGMVARSGTRSTLLAVQAALAIVLLIGAGLFVRSLRKVAELPLGVDVNRVLVGEMEHASVGMTNTEAREAFRRFEQEAPRVPGVTAAATSLGLSFGIGWGTQLFVPGRTPPAATHGPNQYAVTPEYFQVLGIRLVAGRVFTDGDRPGTSPVVIVNQTAARTYWPDGNALGACLKVGADTMPCTTVVGIVTDARRQDVIEQPTSQVYRPLDQLPASVTDQVVSFFGYSFIVRTTRDPAEVAEPLRRALQRALPNIPYVYLHPLRDRVVEQTRTWTVGATMFSVFGALALVLAVVGLYGVVAFTIAQRRHEFGVRVALGATSTHLMRLTVIRGVRPAAAGMLAGVGLALLGGRLVAGLLYDLSPNDPVVFVAVTALLLTAAVLASLVPALRVRKVDPMTALRSD